MRVATHGLLCTLCGVYCRRTVLPRYLQGLSRHYRQTVLLSSFANAHMNALVAAAAARGGVCSNHAGVARLRLDYPGALGQVIPQVRGICLPTYLRCDTCTPTHI